MSKTTEQVAHTPGPWRVFRGEGVLANKWYVRYCNGERCPTLAQMKAGNGACSRDEQEANAHLIAAAPAMLEALDRCECIIAGQVICGEPSSWCETLDAVRAAIAQARGTA